MKPMGRKYYNDKTGGKHHIKVSGKFMAWWTDICEPNKRKERRESKKIHNKKLYLDEVIQ